MINKKFEGSENQLNSTSNFGTPPLNQINVDFEGTYNLNGQFNDPKLNLSGSSNKQSFEESIDLESSQYFKQILQDVEKGANK